jgi:hypothetical protein
MQKQSIPRFKRLMKSGIDPQLIRKIVGQRAMQMTLYYYPASKPELDAAQLAAKTILEAKTISDLIQRPNPNLK